MSGSILNDSPTRRKVLAGCGAFFGSLAAPVRAASSYREAPYNAAGERVGEVTDHSAIVHTRLTAEPLPNARGYSVPIDPHSLNIHELTAIRMPDGMKVSGLEGACTGKGGKARLLYSTTARLEGGEATDWVEIGDPTDFTHPFSIGGLKPATNYHYAVELKASSGDAMRRGAPGVFKSAPRKDDWTPVDFAVISCQDYACRDDMGGFRTYRAIRKQNPAFLVSTGDNVYYDHDLPFATTTELARFHWHRMYSQPSLKEVFAAMSGYWMKDDHDSFEDDDWPTREAHRVAPMTYATLSPIFLEQVPIGPKTYRSFRWGKGLEIFLVEGRDFRSPNPEVDSPKKTIWGASQKAWVKQAILDSDADFRVLITPTCIVGPDPSHGSTFKLPGGGADSCCDGGFGAEGREIRQWVHDHGLKNFLVINGDRHWQYFSIDPETQVREACCGTITDAHCVKDPPNDPRYHRYVRPKGGYVSVSLTGSVRQSKLVVRFQDVNGKTCFEYTA